MLGKLFKILIQDDDGPIDIQKTSGQSNKTEPARIQWRPGVPDPAKDPKGFDDLLKKWHEAHNGS